MTTTPWQEQLLASLADGLIDADDVDRLWDTCECQRRPDAGHGYQADCEG